MKESKDKTPKSTDVDQLEAIADKNDLKTLKQNKDSNSEHVKERNHKGKNSKGKKVESTKSLISNVNEKMMEPSTTKPTTIPSGDVGNNSVSTMEVTSTLDQEMKDANELKQIIKENTLNVPSVKVEVVNTAPKITKAASNIANMTLAPFDRIVSPKQCRHMSYHLPIPSTDIKSYLNIPKGEGLHEDVVNVNHDHLLSIWLDSIGLLDYHEVVNKVLSVGDDRNTDVREGLRDLSIEASAPLTLDEAIKTTHYLNFQKIKQKFYPTLTTSTAGFSRFYKTQERVFDIIEQPLIKDANDYYHTTLVKNGQLRQKLIDLYSFSFKMFVPSIIDDHLLTSNWEFLGKWLTTEATYNVKLREMFYDTILNGTTQCVNYEVDTIRQAQLTQQVRTVSQQSITRVSPLTSLITTLGTRTSLDSLIKLVTIPTFYFSGYRLQILMSTDLTLQNALYALFTLLIVPSIYINAKDVRLMKDLIACVFFSSVLYDLARNNILSHDETTMANRTHDKLVYVHSWLVQNKKPSKTVMYLSGLGYKKYDPSPGWVFVDKQTRLDLTTYSDMLPITHQKKYFSGDSTTDDANTSITSLYRRKLFKGAVKKSAQSRTFLYHNRLIEAPIYETLSEAGNHFRSTTIPTFEESQNAPPEQVTPFRGYIAGSADAFVGMTIHRLAKANPETRTPFFNYFAKELAAYASFTGDNSVIRELGSYEHARASSQKELNAYIALLTNETQVTKGDKKLKGRDNLDSMLTKVLRDRLTVASKYNVIIRPLYLGEVTLHSDLEIMNEDLLPDLRNPDTLKSNRRGPNAFSYKSFIDHLNEINDSDLYPIGLNALMDINDLPVFIQDFTDIIQDLQTLSYGLITQTIAKSYSSIFRIVSEHLLNVYSDLISTTKSWQRAQFFSPHPHSVGFLDINKFLDDQAISRFSKDDLESSDLFNIYRDVYSGFKNTQDPKIYDYHVVVQSQVLIPFDPFNFIDSLLTMSPTSATIHHGRPWLEYPNFVHDLRRKAMAFEYTNAILTDSYALESVSTLYYIRSKSVRRDMLIKRAMSLPHPQNLFDPMPFQSRYPIIAYISSFANNLEAALKKSISPFSAQLGFLYIPKQTDITQNNFYAHLTADEPISSHSYITLEAKFYRTTLQPAGQNKFINLYRQLEGVSRVPVPFEIVIENGGDFEQPLPISVNREAGDNFRMKKLIFKVLGKQATTLSDLFTMGNYQLYLPLVPFSKNTFDQFSASPPPGITPNEIAIDLPNANDAGLTNWMGANKALHPTIYVSDEFNHIAAPTAFLIPGSEFTFVDVNTQVMASGY